MRMRRRGTSWRPKRSRLGALLLIGALAIALLLALWLFWNHERILDWKREADPLSFFLLMAVLPALGFPITPLFVLAGAVFGTLLGLLGSLLALAANLVLCHWIAHSGLRPYLERLLARTRYRLPSFDGRQRSALRFTLLLRITPGVPLFIKNYLLGFSGIPLRLHFRVSMLLTGAYGAGFVLLGESMLKRNLAEATIGLLVVVVIALAVLLLRRLLRAGEAAP
ncbi:MAG: VTT domain-containing protein [Halochromatium sp.]|uniref:VTT domain-containing protein n=2 Tax=Halochromatium sp. TaxID=2049430 RepID=UPI00397E83DD